MRRLALLLLVASTLFQVPVAAQSASCADYTTFEWAQTVFESDPALFAGLDPDGDGFACPDLPNGIAPSIWTSAVPAGAEQVMLNRVVDGDTAEFVRSDGSVIDVRFILIDTPETVAPTQPVGCFGREASAFTEFLLTLPADLDCGDINASSFPVYQPDPHGLDGDFDGIGCEPPPAPAQPPPPQPPAPQPGNCDPSYPTLCLPSFPDLNCRDVAANGFLVSPPDPHGFDGDFDGDGDGVGCE